MKHRVFILAAVLMAAGGPVRASDHGCTVLLCLANPAGPMAVAECVPPIKKLFRDLARGKSFPSCAMASAPDAQGGKSWAEHGASNYDHCPAGTTALEAGAYTMRSGASSSYYVGIGEGSNVNSSDSGSLPSKTCAGRQIGDSSVIVGEGEAMAMLPVAVYDQVLVVEPSARSKYIDVYVDSAFLHRVRW
jgi:hypothetical protein